MKTRLAPTPSGFLHPGNGVSFLVTWALARAAGGSVRLRIDDLDADRVRREYLEDIFLTLEWIGIDYDEGPAGVEDFQARFSQFLRLDLYQEALDRLREGGHLYACSCSRRQIRERSVSGIYPNTCRERGRSFSAPATAWRVRVPEKDSVAIPEWRRPEPILVPLAEVMGDFIVRQKNGRPAYQIASLVDDLHYDISFVVRGEDLLASTAAQIFLAGRLGEERFRAVTFWHHPLLTDPAGEKLSKSKGAGSLRAWREAGRSPLPLYREAAGWLELAPEFGESHLAIVEGLKLLSSRKS